MMTAVGEKVIFLDMDGVLNNSHTGFGGFTNEFTKANINWNEECLARLKKIVDATDAKIVISSTWRLFFPISWFKRAFHIYGWDNVPIVGVTGEDEMGSREKEIQLWIATAPFSISSYISLDDYPVKNSRLIQTSIDAGLQDVHVERAVAALNGAPHGGQET